MRWLPRMVAVIASASALLLPATAAFARTYPPPVSRGEGTADPSRVGVGECTTFSGGGFRPLSNVDVSDDGHFVRTVTSDASGNFAAQVCFNSDAKPGKHTLEGDGVELDGTARVVTAVVYVLGQSVSHVGGNGNGNGGGNGNGNGNGGGNGGGTGNGGSGNTGGTGNGAGNGTGHGVPTTNTSFYRTALAADAGLVVAVVAVGIGSALLMRAERRHRRRRREALAS